MADDNIRQRFLDHIAKGRRCGLHGAELVHYVSERIGDDPRLASLLARYAELLYGPTQPAPVNGDSDESAYDTEVQRAAMGDLEELTEFTVLDTVGRGGQADVYKARDNRLGRIVALKVFRHVSNVSRFHREAEIIARLDHAGIARIHRIGLWEGCPCLVMEFVDGQSLAARIANGSVPCSEGARIVLCIARAVAFAHDEGVIHRDLKPSNVLVSHDGDVKVTDFGTAKVQEGGPTLTRTGDIVGTLGYMAPEQAAGDPGRATPSVDVFALGVILYEMLTGELPCCDAPFLFIGAAHDQHFPSIRTINADTPRELDAICMKCVEAKPSDRYTSAHGLADDLARFLCGDPISVQHDRFLGRLTRVLRRDQLQSELHFWSVATILVAVWIALTSTTAFLLQQFLGATTSYVWPLAVTGSIVVCAILLWSRLRLPYPLSRIERQLIVIIGGMFVAEGVVNVVVVLHNRSTAFDNGIMYAMWAIINGLCCVFMGITFLGWFHMFGVAFFIVAVVVALFPTTAPLLWAAIWVVLLLFFARRLGSLRADWEHRRKRRRRHNYDCA